MLSCDVCGVKFSYKSQLTDHRLVHTGQKPHGCEICGKKFRRLQQCKVHMKLMHGNRGAECQECKKPFGTEWNLLRHNMTFHLNLKRWICGICGQSYAFSQDLRSHLKKLHHYQLNAIEYKLKKSYREAYIIPGLHTYNISDDVRKKIELVYNEEMQKIGNFPSALPTKLSNYSETKNGSFEDSKLYLPSHKSTSGKDLLNGEVVDKCFWCRCMIQNHSMYNLCVHCNAIFCSPTHLTAHIAAAHPILYQCSLCSSKFMSIAMCRNHIDSCHCKDGGAINLGLPTISQYPVVRNVQVLPQANYDFQILPAANLESTLYTGNVSAQENAAASAVITYEAIPQHQQPSHYDTPYFIPGVVVLSKPNSGQLNQLASKGQQQHPLLMVSGSYKDNFTEIPGGGNLVLKSENVLTRTLHAPEIHTQALAKRQELDAGKTDSSKTFAILPNKSCGQLDLASTEPASQVPGIVEGLRVCRKGNEEREAAVSEKPLLKDGENQCRLCGKRFGLPSQLDRHYKTHKAKRHSCHLCDKTFVEKFNLKTHMLVHTQLRPYSCPRCSAVFRYSRDLKEHLQSHEGRLPFQCHVCGAKFLRRRDFKRHEKEQHGQEKYSCKDCGRGFKRSCYLKNVHAKVHLEKYSETPSVRDCKTIGTSTAAPRVHLEDGKEIRGRHSSVT